MRNIYRKYRKLKKCFPTLVPGLSLHQLVVVLSKESLSDAACGQKRGENVDEVRCGH